MSHIALDDKARHEIYLWVDGIPLSRSKGYISRDFADGVMLAEVIHHFLPKLVELHNYQPSTNSENKRKNWETLQQKVLKKLQIRLSSDEVDALISAKAGAIERLLIRVRASIMRIGTKAEEQQQYQHQHQLQQPSGLQSNEQWVVKTRIPSANTSASAPAAVPAAPQTRAAPVSPDCLRGDESARYEELLEENTLLKQKIQTLEKLLAVKNERITVLEKKIGHLEAKLK